MPIISDVSNDDKTKTIKVSGRFDFSAQNEFRGCYNNVSSDGDIEFIIDMTNANYIDSSALGMLLMMREHLGGDTANISIVHCSPELINILNVANFQTLFDVS